MRNHVPTYVLDDLLDARTTLRLAPSWAIKEDPPFLTLYNEWAGTRAFELQSAPAGIVKALAVAPRSIAELGDIVPAPRRRDLLDLWVEGVIRLDDGGISADQTDRSARLPRYIWYEEYLKQFASPTRPVAQMLADLAGARVTIIGLGGLGATLALSLAASGVSFLRLVDGDVIEESNLPRQILYTEASVGELKVNALQRAILANNSAVTVQTDSRYVASQEDADAVVAGSSFVVLCADQPRFAIRNWVGKACMSLRIPHMAMAGQWVGPIFVPGASPCHVCVGRFHSTRTADAPGLVKHLLSEKIPPRASFGPRPLIQSGYMAAAILHYLSGIDTESLTRKRFGFDVFGAMEEETLVRYRNCPMCGDLTQVDARATEQSQ